VIEMISLDFKIEKAREYYTQYGVPFQFPEPWEGLKAVLHPWHALGPLFALSYERSIDRTITICVYKPEHQIAERLRLMRPVDIAVPQYVKLAWDALMKARDTKAENVYLESLRRWNSVKAMQKFHAINCPDCGWDEKAEMLPQFEQEQD
jgi:hypothetical protein